MHQIILPAFFALCASLGITKPQCTQENLYFGAVGYQQVDKRLWYTGTESSPDNKPGDDCYQPIAIARYKMYDGTWGTTYACKAAPEDDRITADELNAIEKAAKRLNATHRKTLEQHELALSLKQWAAALNAH